MHKILANWRYIIK